jgi:hypothetical protein
LHVWILLDVPLNADGERLVDALVAQAEEIVRLAYPSLS